MDDDRAAQPGQLQHALPPVDQVRVVVDEHGDGPGGGRRAVLRRFQPPAVDEVARPPEVVEQPAAAVRQARALAHRRSLGVELRQHPLEAAAGAARRRTVVAQGHELVVVQVVHERTQETRLLRPLRQRLEPVVVRQRIDQQGGPLRPRRVQIPGGGLHVARVEIQPELLPRHPEQDVAKQRRRRVPEIGGPRRGQTVYVSPAPSSAKLSMTG